jgi:ABC-2 type transport system ATP-binding protein
MSTILTASNIRVEFDQVVAVCDVSFELDGGQLLGLVGPNGAGKTTLLRVLAGLHAPNGGIARVMGRAVLGEDEVVRQHIGFAPDSPPAYEELTIQQFLIFIGGMYGLSRAETEERIDFWLEQLWLTERRHSLVKHLSRGMRQRVTLARAFLPRPHVILLDEPLAGLDPGGRVQLRRVLGMLRDQGCAMIVSSHILTDLEEVATHVAILEHGRIIRWVRTDELHKPAGRRRFYRLTTVDVRPEYAEWIGAMPEVTELTSDNGALLFEYPADDRAVARLLAELIRREVPVTSFAPARGSLEEAYLQAGVKQVD